MLGLLRRIEEYVGLSALIMGVLYYVVFFGCILKVSSEFVCLLELSIEIGFI
jgi:hypothetical protein